MKQGLDTEKMRDLETITKEFNAKNRVNLNGKRIRVGEISFRKNAKNITVG